MKNTLYYEFQPIDAFMNCIDIGLNAEKPVKIIGINSYKDEAITFTVVIDGALYDYISPEHIKYHGVFENSSILSLKDLVYNNNVSEEFTVIHSEYVKKHIKSAYFKERNIWVNILKYYFSIDWFNDNDKRHFVLLTNGQFAFVPNHKIKLDNNMTFDKSFKKIKEVYKV